MIASTGRIRHGFVEPIRAALMPSRPLSGTRILDLSRLLPGPVATLHLADLGAEVIKVEDTGTGDSGRFLGPMHGTTSWFFETVNRNKRSLCLDLKRPDGVAVFLDLCRGADVVVEGFRPGVMDRLGVGYDAVRAVNPRTVYASITGYGQTGPLRHRAGHDINYIGYAGVLDQTGPAGGPPVVPNFQIGDVLGGALMALVGILAALTEARTTGRGRHVDVAMTDAVLAHAVFPLVSVVSAGSAPARGEGLLSGGVPCYGVYPTRDGRYMAVGALEEKFWRTFCTALGRPDLVPLQMAEGEAGGKARREIETIFRGRTQREWVELFEPLDCCVTPVLTPGEALASEQARVRGLVSWDGGTPRVGLPLGLSDFVADSPRPAPAAGADTDSILRQAGYDAARIAALRAGAVVR
jgi:crotonobetainyl-CoA:carnitine CoA-transferase CaiB-like acyl-CoA transferase